MTTPIDYFFDTVKRHVRELVTSKADAMTCISFQNLIYAMIVAFESVVEDEVDSSTYILLDEEQLSNRDGFACDDRVPIYDGSDGLLDGFRACISNVSLEKLDALEERVMILMDEFPEGRRYFTMVAESCELDEKYILEALPALEEPEPAPMPEPVPATPPPTPVPILKKARRVTRRLNRATKSAPTRRVRWA